MEHREAVQSQAVERYTLREMSEAERLAFEEHYFDCAECAAGVEAGAVLAANTKAVFEEEARAVRPERAWFRWLWPAAAFAGLFLALFCYVRLARYQAEQAGRRPEAFAVFFLHGVARGEDQVVTFPRGAAFAGVALDVPPARAFSEYECVLLDESGQRKWPLAAPAPLPGTPINVLIPADSVRPGRYTLVLYGRDGRSRVELQRFLFLIRFQ